ncbi:RES domain-containing protein [Mesorhizobium sp.]|uniref:RES domain-containing protein n=1 Tax=Mesorhizobium sp. TaxID=1871066 RepID=UPI003457FAFF
MRQRPKYQRSRPRLGGAPARSSEPSSRILSSFTPDSLASVDEDAPGFELTAPLAASALLAAPRNREGCHKRQYVFSRFVADCARAAGYEAIRYASTKNVDGTNVVIRVKASFGLSAGKRY